ncbi:hypothetical protein T484DRAFT_1943126 [Baffinella frigidus]|nr:hypothetical protein T484DRAFT_1943126 [Cryptophyta sp. CCMP2293]
MTWRGGSGTATRRWRSTCSRTAPTTLSPTSKPHYNTISQHYNTVSQHYNASSQHYNTTTWRGGSGTATRRWRSTCKNTAMPTPRSFFQKGV